MASDGEANNTEGCSSNGDLLEASVCSSAKAEILKEMIDFKVVYNKQKFDVSFPYDETVGSLKQHIHTLTGVPPAMQKVMIKGLAKDEKTLRDQGLLKGSKVMVVGSTLNDVLAVNTPTKHDQKEEKATTPTKEPLCRQKIHKKVIDKGVPDDCMPGIKNAKESLPPFPLSGMVNKSGGKVRLTFKLEVDQLWIGTKGMERTEKVGMNSIKNVISEPIEGHEEYHVMGLQLGPTEASRYWIYWVPAQYVDAIKDAVLGKWQYF
ncbi:ubiquitin domain-containing protein UBFD1-like isoform X1 [Limulus polyphemus]|uniref:Ubiquitin domain-containing protein UBFD1-like isoform X1 n=1 Tax=Limulus polyphemus TaxID=6850 RepID=A0ABM1BCM5_LIMPO|nr:ubiquitin domain-containing protein UBFD1-like isoform X1 [Limulus polyphemus]